MQTVGLLRHTVHRSNLEIYQTHRQASWVWPRHGRWNYQMASKAEIPCLPLAAVT